MWVYRKKQSKKHRFAEKRISVFPFFCEIANTEWVKSEGRDLFGSRTSLAVFGWMGFHLAKRGKLGILALRLAEDRATLESDPSADEREKGNPKNETASDLFAGCLFLKSAPRKAIRGRRTLCFLKNGRNESLSFSLKSCFCISVLEGPKSVSRTRATELIASARWVLDAMACIAP